MEFRELGNQALTTILKIPNNVEVFEKNIFKLSEKMKEEDPDYEEQTLEEIYKRNIYQIVGDVLKNKKTKQLLVSIKTDKLGWEHYSYENIKNKIEEREDFLVNPFEVEDGVLECRCGSSRVFSYSKATRSSDEKTTIHAQCMACKSKWIE
jgi:DNA-directed RNA polymerase subunit M/transcription elongation factor TFIIS